MKQLKITALSLVLVLLLAACGAKVDTPDEPAVDPTPEPPIAVSYTHLTLPTNSLV